MNELLVVRSIVLPGVYPSNKYEALQKDGSWQAIAVEKIATHKGRVHWNPFNAQGGE